MTDSKPKVYFDCIFLCDVLPNKHEPNKKYLGGDEGIRTLDPHVANVVLSQLSYIPKNNRFSSVLPHLVHFNPLLYGSTTPVGKVNNVSDSAFIIK